MKSFLELHGESILGTLNTFDRVIFKGHLNGFFPSGAFARYLWQRTVLLKDAGRFFEAETRRIRDHIEAVAAAAGRPVEYLAGASTHRSGRSKEARARQIAERDGVTEGLVCVLSVVDPCRSFTVVPNRQALRLEVVHRPRKCLHYYLYFIDPEFGWMHVRIQTWAPYQIQVYVNGREWLARQLDRAGIGYRRSDNKIIAVDDLAKALDLCQRFAHTDWPPFLDRQAALVNPLLPAITAAGFPGYWWVIDQSEYASDILFTGRAALEAIRGDLVTAAVTALGATDVMHFLGRKPHHAFAGEVTIDSKKRPEGCRVRFRLKANAVKFYDHANLLRVETTINNPREFKVLRSPADGTDEEPRWCPMTKGVANFWRYAEVAHAANGRLLEALARVPLTGEATAELDALCQPATPASARRVAAFNPVAPATVALFAALLSGEFAINGFRNRDLQGKLYPAAPTDAADSKRRTHRISRLIAKLRGHGLITKVKNSRLYRLTARGLKAMWPAIRFRRSDFPNFFREVQAALAA
jgi:hypothetical protein